MREILANHIDAMPTTTHAARMRQARARWIVDLLLGTGLRISELLATTMGAFRVETKEDAGKPGLLRRTLVA